MIEPFLRAKLEPIARRRRLWNVSRDLALCWMVATAIAVIFFLSYRLTGWIATWLLPVLGCGTLLASLLVWRRGRRWEPDYRQIAGQVEQRHPELHALLLTAVEQQPDAETGQFNFLQQRVINEAVQESLQTDWLDTISRPRMVGMQLVQAAAFVLLLVALSGLRVQTKEAAALAKPTSISVSPGDASVERGNGLAVLARFDGPLPPDVTLVIRPDSQLERRMPMMKSLNDPVFGGTMAEVTNSFSYYVAFPGGRSRDYKVDVFEFPRLERADAHLTYPEYTGLAEKRIDNTRRVSAVEGSTLDLSLQLNKPVVSARLIARDKAIVPLTAQTNRANAQLDRFPLRTSQVYELVLVDDAGRTNKVPAQVIVDVLTNRVPELRIESPRGDQRVSPLQEISFKGEAWDDFGLKAYGITYTLAGSKPQTIALGGESPGRDKRQFGCLLKLEELGAQPDQFLSYFIWADDIGPDGQVRRTASDMYYAEVRPFEEIFREGQSQSQSQEQESEQEESGNEATKLAELQKQIINATWRLQRDNRVGLSPAETSESATSSKGKPAPAPNYGNDVTVVEQSQKDALKQATAKKGQSQNPESKALWDKVEKAMSNAADQLGKATKSPAPLPAAVEAEQSAYQALLKLSAHEYQIAQSRRSRSKSNSNQAMQRELDQLDLKQSENRYESQKQAASKQNPEQREQQQVLNRLKELAQRQQDLNERLKELQTALQEAKSDQEREDIRRRLKRLREEEQQMVSDVDELLQRMDRPENQSKMADSRQQLEQTRNQVQRASEMIEKESVSQALSSGTRAQRELQDLREDFRKKSAAQFAEEMRQMRSDARDLAQKEDQISDQLQSLADTKRKTLSDAGETAKLSQQLGQQGQKMTNLLQQMTRVSQESENAEPLLSKQLYDTLRKASQGNVDDSLQKADQLLKLSFLNQAGQFEQRAHKGIDEVKDGVERAAESVLGDETQALRLARNELDDIARQVEKEIAQSDQASNSGSPNGKPSQDRQPGVGQNGKSPGQADQQNSNGEKSSTQQPGTSQNQSAQNGQRQQGQRGSPGQGNSQNQTAQSAQSQQAGQTPGQQGSPNPNERNPGDQAQNGARQGGQANSPQSGQAQANSQPGGSEQPAGNGRNGDQARSQPNSRQPGQARQRAGLSGEPRQGQSPSNPGAARQPTDQAAAGQGGENGRRGPITGEDFADWSDQLRDVEELLDYPDLRNEVAGVRESARAMRIDFKRSRKAPQSAVLRAQLAEPLAEVRNRINEELARRESKDSLVPIDRDPVPQKFSELVRRYYEKLGSEQESPPPRQD